MTAPLTYIDSGPDIEQRDRPARASSSTPTSRGRHLRVLARRRRPGARAPRRSTIPRLALGRARVRGPAVHPPMLDADGELLDPLYEPVPSTYEWTVVDLTPPDTRDPLRAARRRRSAIDAVLRLRRERRHRDARVLARLRGLQRLRAPEVVRGPARRRAHPPGPRRRRVPERRPDAGDATAGRSTRPRRTRRSASTSRSSCRCRIAPGDGDGELLRGQARRRDHARAARRRPAVACPATAGRRPLLRRHHHGRLRRPGAALHALRPGDVHRGPAPACSHYDGSEWTDITAHQRPGHRAGSAASRRTSGSSRSPPASTCRRWRRSTPGPTS